MNARRSYLGMVTYIDELAGKLIDELDNLGIAEDTVVCFTSDHGDMQGEHGMWYKRTYREWSSRVPMIFHIPGAPEGLTVNSPVSLLDLFPTITDLAHCGTSWPGAEDLEGDSLLPLIRGEKETKFTERPVYIEYCGEGTTEPMVAVRKGKWKYAGVNKHEPMLFDLESDPLENINLMDDKKGETKEAADSLSHLVNDYWDFEKLKEKVIEDQKKRRFLYKSLERNDDIWDYEPEDRAADTWIRRGRSTQGEKAKHRWPFVPRE
jgi:choline-sulfatase